MSPRALAQRRDAQRKHGEPVVQVGAEPAVRDLGRQIAVGRRHDPDVDPDRLVGAHALHLTLLQDAEELGLRVERQLADLVEEQRAAVGELELPGAVGDRTGERAADMAEQLALDDALGERRAVDLDQRCLATARAVVDRARCELLAHAGLAEDQHRELGGRDDVDLLAHALHRGADAEHLRPVGVPQPARQLLDHEPALLGDRLDRLDQPRGMERRTGQRTERDQELLAEPVERMDRERIRGQHTDDLAFRDQRTAEAVMNGGERVRIPVDQPVERIRQRRVCREPHGLLAAQDRLQPRMVRRREPHPEHLRRQALHRERTELAALQREQRRRVAGDHGPHDREEPLIAIRRTQALGQIDGDPL